MPPIQFCIDTQKRIVTWRGEGRITQDEVEKMRREIDAQASFKEGWHALLDLRSQENTLSPEYLRQFSRNLPIFPYPVKWAVVVGTPVAQGMANMFSILVEEKNVWVRLFDHLEEAEAWLCADTNGFHER